MTMRRTMWMMSSTISLALVFLLTMMRFLAQAQALPNPGLPGSYEVASVTVTTSNPETGSDLETDIYYPSGDGTTVDPSEAPYATLVFARGFMAFPTSYSGWGEHLASWGYIVAFPDFPSEDREVRVSDIQHLLSFLEAENVNSDSPLFQSIDVDRFGQAGHSAGGLSSMIVAARDERTKAVVALDPAGNPTEGWDYEAEAPDITVPIAVIGAPPQLCNSDGAYNDWFPHVGAAHKALYVIANGSHCDFMDTDEELQVQLCSLLCGPFSQERLELAKRYATAWFNYYLHYDPDYHTYLYGDEADADIQADRIARDVQTAPRDVTAIGRLDEVELHWRFYDHPMVVGYNVYRSQLTGDYPSAPAAQLGLQSVYTDTTVVAGETYYYVLRSRDTAGNEHQPSDEVSAMAGCPPPTAGFDASPTDCCVPLTVVFTDTSAVDTSVVPTNTVEGWYWQFGDGVGSSSDQNPIYTYDEPGIYTVTLTVTDSQGSSDTDVQPSYIKSNPWPTASFDASPTDCCLPLTAVFTDTSIADTSVVPTNTIESWYWQFGDGAGSSSEQNPIHTYDEPGVYTVTLTVTDSHGCSDHATDVVQVEREFESFVYLPLTVRGERAEDPESDSTIQRGQPPRIEAVLDVVMDLLRRLFTGPSGSGDHAP
jgi:PKD repeat protein/predicted dienelactone hydrolase